MATYLLLHNIRSTYNVGSIFRTADAAGVEKIFLTGYTPTPTDRHGRTRSDISKTALGAEGSVAWEYHAQPGPLVKELKDQSVRVVGVEQDERSIPLTKYSSQKKELQDICWILGNEVRGISSQLRRQCDELVEIPMCGKKESLNVSVAAGIVLFC
ncbi:MAG: RNA methyltransferase [Candidatus Paceibacterota bacterium]